MPSTVGWEWSQRPCVELSGLQDSSQQRLVKETSLAPPIHHDRGTPRGEESRPDQRVSLWVRWLRQSPALLGCLVPEERVELSWGCPRRILSPVRLPFRHSGSTPALNLPLRMASRHPRARRSVRDSRKSEFGRSALAPTARLLVPATLRAAATAGYGGGGRPGPCRSPRIPGRPSMSPRARRRSRIRLIWSWRRCRMSW